MTSTKPVVAPKNAKIVREGGVSVRTNTTKDAEWVGLAKSGESYEVKDTIVSYYQIELPNKKTGWFFANPRENWTKTLESSQVEVLLESGITVREIANDPTSEVIGFAIPGFKFRILAAEYSYLKISLTADKEGWIYCGKPQEPWVDYKTQSLATR